MENNKLQVKDGHNLNTLSSWKMLAWMDLVFTWIPSVFFVLFLISVLCNPNQSPEAKTFSVLILIFTVPLAAFMMVSGLSSFRLLKKMNLRGIRISLTYKVVILVLGILFLLATTTSDETQITFTFLSIIILVLILYFFTLYCKKQYNSNDNQKK